jgi:hypothetical protein
VSATVAAGLVALVIFIFAIPKLRPAHSPRLLPYSITFLTVWLVASLIPYTLFFVKRSAQVTAFVGPVQLPAKVIAQVEAMLGSTPLYRKKEYRESYHKLK